MLVLRGHAVTPFGQISDPIEHSPDSASPIADAIGVAVCQVVDAKQKVLEFDRWHDCHRHSCYHALYPRGKEKVVFTAKLEMATRRESTNRLEQEISSISPRDMIE